MATKKTSDTWPFGPADTAVKKPKAKKKTRAEQHEELIEILKFTPRTYTVTLWGYGGEVVLGSVDGKIYDYFKENNIDISEYAWDYDNEAGVPEDLQPFDSGSWYDCDNICHENGVEMCDSSGITVTDENGKVVWESGLDPATLEKQDISCSSGDDYYADDQPQGTCVFMGFTSDKGTFFEEPLELKQAFDYKKFSFSYNNIEGRLTFASMSYDGSYIEDNCNGSTDGKSSDFYLVKVGEDD